MKLLFFKKKKKLMKWFFNFFLNQADYYGINKNKTIEESK